MTGSTRRGFLAKRRLPNELVSRTPTRISPVRFGVVRPALPTPPVAAGATSGLVWVSDGSGNAVRVAPAMVPYVGQLRSRAGQLGVAFRLVSGYRSPAEQAALLRRYQAGDPSVIYPPANPSYHSVGLAIDIASSPAGLRALGDFAESIGMRWGGRFGDPVHFDLGR